MLETALRRSAGCPLTSARLALAFDGSAASLDQIADVRQLFSPDSGVQIPLHSQARDIPHQMMLPRCGHIPAGTSSVTLEYRTDRQCILSNVLARIPAVLCSNEGPSVTCDLRGCHGMQHALGWSESCVHGASY